MNLDVNSRLGVSRNALKLHLKPDCLEICVIPHRQNNGI